jgi:hypothetical protein
MFFYSITIATTPYRQPTATGTPGTPIGSVRFFGTAVAGIDNIAPYQSTPLRTPGTYSITAIPYNQPGALGTPGSGFSSNLVLVNQTPTPTPTPSPTAPFCPAVLSQPSNSLLNCPNTLADFGIELVGTWTSEEQAEILLAANETGNALLALGVGQSPVEAFRRVLEGMNGGSWRQIQFSRISGGGVYCTTTPNPSSGVSGLIECDTGVAMNQYTAVHELGHVFDGRTGGAFRASVEDPDGAGSSDWA